MISAAPMCNFCARLRLDRWADGGRVGCDAFPGGIPDDIQRSGYDHREAYPGDRGVRFEERTDRPIPEDVLERARVFEPSAETFWANQS